MSEKNVKQRLTQSQKESIIRMYVNGTPIAHLAQQFKVSRPTIYSVVENMDKDEQTKIDFYFEKSEQNKDNMEPVTKTNFLGVTNDGALAPSLVTPKFSNSIICGSILSLFCSNFWV